jgi:alkylation response protein AidB-like acyl-CoA dehydrogenase
MTTTDTVQRPDFSARQRHFIFTDEHDQLRESVRAFVLRELAPYADEWEETGFFPNSVFRRMGELGFLGLDKPERYGGQGGDYYSAIVLGEELTRCRSGGVAMGLTVQTDLTLPPLLAFGTEEQKRQWAVPAISGEKILCLGITEPDAGSDVSGIKTRAVLSSSGDEYVLNGSKTFITNGQRADMIVLLAKTDPDAGYDGFTLFLVPMDSPGVVREKSLKKLGMHASDTALLAFQDVRVPSSAMLGQVGRGFYHIMWELQGERLIGAAAAVAWAERAFEAAVAYAAGRTAFGAPIGKLQSIRHKLAEMATKIEAARDMVYTTAWRFAEGQYPVREISMAKLFTSRIAFEIADQCLQIHGGNGYMREYGIERLWRDLRLYRIGGGTDEVMLDVVGRTYV